MTAAFDVAIAAKALSPLFVSLAKAATGAVQDGMAKWKASGFAERQALKLASADRVKTIWSRDRFVSLTECYHPSRINRDGFQIAVNSIVALPNQHVVIEGIVGQGKSMFIQYLYLQELSGLGSGGLPLLIFLRTITPKRGLLDHIKEALTNLEIDPTDAVLDYLAKSGKLILMLDGFDELEHDVVTETITAIDSLIFKYPTVRVIITSRPNSDIQKSHRLEVLQLSALESEDYDPFLAKLNIDIVRRVDIINAIKVSPADIIQLISTPLMLTLVAHVYAAEKEIPAELPLFFERLFATTFVNHDKQKGGGFRRHHYSGLSERKLQILFESFCFLTLKKDIGRTLTGEQFSTVFEGALDLTEDAQCDVGNFKQDITKVACLMLDDGFDQTSFLHMSIAEYFAAAFLKRSNEKFAARFYEYVIASPGMFGVVLSFLEKIDSYRFNKFYLLPQLKNFFDSVNSTSQKEITEETWLSFIRTTYATMEAGFGDSNARGKLSLRSMLLGGGVQSKFGFLVKDLITKRFFSIYRGMEYEESMFAENAKWFRFDPRQRESVRYVTGIEGLIEVFGKEDLVKNMRQVEYSLWVRYNQAKAIVDNEDSKTDLVAW
jgi:hypothetical protein